MPRIHPDIRKGSPQMIPRGCKASTQANKRAVMQKKPRKPKQYPKFLKLYSKSPNLQNRDPEKMTHLIIIFIILYCITNVSGKKIKRQITTQNQCHRRIKKRRIQEHDLNKNVNKATFRSHKLHKEKNHCSKK